MKKMLFRQQKKVAEPKELSQIEFEYHGEKLAG